MLVATHFWPSTVPHFSPLARRFTAPGDLYRRDRAAAAALRGLIDRLRPVVAAPTRPA